MKKAMFSAPMAGRTDAQIDEVRSFARKYLEDMGYEFVNTVFRAEAEYAPDALEQSGVKNVPLRYLAGSLENLSKCDAILFCRGWQDARGCRIEHQVAKDYGVLILYEEE